MTNDELRSRTERINLELNYADAVRNAKKFNAKQKEKGKNFIQKVGSDIILPVATDKSRQLFSSYMTKWVNEGFKLNDEYKIYTNNKRK